MVWVWIGKSNRNGKSLKSMDPRLSGLVCFASLQSSEEQMPSKCSGAVAQSWLAFCLMHFLRFHLSERRKTLDWYMTRHSQMISMARLRIRSPATAGQVTVTLKLMFAVSLPESDKTTAALQDSARKSPDNWKVFSSGWLRHTHKS